ncbi:MAG: hypothetical protein CL840_08265 [Crocinitomicaceae bacterium]|nr:hypothetical protein [Crocinitomicaceae bacterium]|tara:strand:+ start:19527 stop:20414 length:888 start_codon:yes stop_codon:yes gene_type:complete
MVASIKNSSRIVGLLAFLCVVFIQVQAQDETMNIGNVGISSFKNDTLWTYGNEPILVLVPFEPIMYKSQIDRSIGTNDGTTYNQIVNNFRRGLDNVIYIENQSRYSIVRMIVDEEEIKKDLYALYTASTRDYRVVPKENDGKKEKKIKLLSKKDKNTEEEKQEHGTRIEAGQIVSNDDGQERFMARVIKDSSIFDYMYGKYGSVLYLFINQFDIGPQPGLDNRAFESGEYQRQIKVHYSIYTHKQEVYSGVVVTGFSSEVNSQKDIIIENFPALAQQIANHIPVAITGGIGSEKE